MSDPIKIKLGSARTKLILGRPFLGALALRLPLMDATEWCSTTATDAKSFYYNRDYIDSLSIEQTQFMLAHDALHCALLHFARRRYREKHRWDIACDFAVNSLLINDGLKPPPNVLYLKEYDGLTAEEIYPLIDDQLDQEPMDQHVYDRDFNADSSNQTSDSDSDERDICKQQQSGTHQAAEKKQKPSSDTRKVKGGNDKNTAAEQNMMEQKTVLPPLLKEEEKQDLAIQWQQRMAGAAQAAIQAGKLGGGIARIVDHLLQPQLPWRMLLARYMSAVARDDYSFTRPTSRREQGGAIYPSLRSSQINLMVIVDSSGSIVDDEINNFFSEINAIKGQIRARITLHACDAKMADGGPWVYEAWEEIIMPGNIKGGGGTDFRPAIEWANRCDQPPDLLVYFTDAQGHFPAIEPSWPVIWLVKGKSPVPWGQRIQLN